MLFISAVNQHLLRWGDADGFADLRTEGMYVCVRMKIIRIRGVNVSCCFWRLWTMIPTTPPH